MGAPLGLGFYRESLENQENPISCKGTKQSVPARRGCGIAKREDRREVDHFCSLEWGGEVPRCPTGCEFPARGADPLGTNCPSSRWDPPFFTNCRQKVPRFSPFFHVFGAIRASYHAEVHQFLLLCPPLLQIFSTSV